MVLLRSILCSMCMVYLPTLNGVNSWYMMINVGKFIPYTEQGTVFFRFSMLNKRRRMT